MRKRMDDEGVRVRVLFEDLEILTKSQYSQGLHRTWILMSPEDTTIQQFSSRIIYTFNLSQSCPFGIRIHMDGFVCPPFESTDIIKDKDIISVKKNQCLFSDTSNLCEEDELIKNQPVHNGMKLLKINVVEEDKVFPCGGFEGDPVHTPPEENSLRRKSVSKKRKAPKKLESSMRKKKFLALPEDIEDDLCAEKPEKLRLRKTSLKKILPKKMRKSSSVKKKHNVANTSETTKTSFDSLPSPNLSIRTSENATHILEISNATDGTIKFPSRSSRRKKAKRKWLRELAQAENIANVENIDEVDMVELGQAVDIVIDKVSTGHQTKDQTHNMENDVVPVVIRPGHIRFEPIEVDADQVVQQNQVPVENYHWHGITSKKKGQKWGTEKMSSHWTTDQECSEMLAPAVVTIVNNPSAIDFDKLSPLVCLPKEGDVIVYRLLELSPSWTPELSTFRVGRVSSYDPKCRKIVLMPDPDYPIPSENHSDEDEHFGLPDNSLYMEDGSLQIDFISLSDVRILKLGESYLCKEMANGSHCLSQNAISDTVPELNSEEKVISGIEESNGWEEVNKVLMAKKMELIGLDNSGRKSWSFRGLRGSGLGHTMARLRLKNDL